jgi:hypothetical protein
MLTARSYTLILGYAQSETSLSLGCLRLKWLYPTYRPTADDVTFGFSMDRVKILS